MNVRFFLLFPLAALAGLFAAFHVDWLMLKDGQFGKEFFLTLNPFLVIVLSPLLVWFWAALRAARR